MERATSKGFRLHIGFFGRRNVGKSSLLNAITKQTVSIVSDVPGTTTDPVEKPMELEPIGPVLFLDTAGVDDVGALGAQRIEKTRQAIARADIGGSEPAHNGTGRALSAREAGNGSALCNDRRRHRRFPRVALANRAG